MSDERLVATKSYGDYRDFKWSELRGRDVTLTFEELREIKGGKFRGSEVWIKYQNKDGEFVCYDGDNVHFVSEHTDGRLVQVPHGKDIRVCVLLVGSFSTKYGDVTRKNKKIKVTEDDYGKATDNHSAYKVFIKV